MDVLPVTRVASARLQPDPSRVLAKPFLPREEFYAAGGSRLQIVLERIMAMSDAQTEVALRAVADDFGGRHRSLERVLERSFSVVAECLAHLAARLEALPPTRRRLVGAYFTHEYALEGAALTNPSMVLAPDQSGLAPGAARVVMSLRAIGEGHVSSIAFRTGVIGADLSVAMDEPSPFVSTGEREAHGHDKAFFSAKLGDLGALNDIEARILEDLSDRFTIDELEAAIGRLDATGLERSISGETTRLLHWLASSNYRLSFEDTTLPLSEQVLFPSGPTESHGMEDARFVRFVDDDGEVTYYATYTAYDGHQILPQLLETPDFRCFRITTLRGEAAHNKGLALFPRRIGGKFVALGRHDNVNNFVMMSDDVRVWRDTAVVQQPEQPWELMQLGNCGSPIETDAGWLVVTHGVGPFRTYSLGALLLDLDDPTRVVGHLDEPLLLPVASERDGYVPNVVYSCGSVVHAGHLVIPYGRADVGAGVATVALDALLDRLRS